MIATDTELVLDATFVMMFTATLIPLLVGLITKINASSMVKSVSMIVLNALAAFVTTSTLADGSAVFTKEGFIAFGIGVGQSVAIYLGIWKPTGVSEKINLNTAVLGVGGDKYDAIQYVDDLKELQAAARV